MYNRKGRRIKGTKLVKNSIINYTGKIKTTDKDAVYTFYKGSGNQFYQLDQYKIKGKTYYAVGGGRYISAYNVVNGQGDNAELYARVKVGKNYRYLWWGDYNEYPQDDPTSNFQICFNLRTQDYENLAKSYFDFKSHSVNIYQHWAHKDGYYPTYRWNSSKVSVFMLSQQGKKNRILNVSDFATEK